MQRDFRTAFAILVAVLAILAVPSLAGTPLGTAFTYQGKLTGSAGAPIWGTRPMTFKVFDALTGGNQVASTIAMSTVDVSGGVFTVQLDFGIGVFLGDRRWMDIRGRR